MLPIRSRNLGLPPWGAPGDGSAEVSQAKPWSYALNSQSRSKDGNRLEQNWNPHFQENALTLVRNSGHGPESHSTKHIQQTDLPWRARQEKTKAMDPSGRRNHSENRPGGIVGKTVPRTHLEELEYDPKEAVGILSILRCHQTSNLHLLLSPQSTIQYSSRGLLILGTTKQKENMGSTSPILPKVPIHNWRRHVTTKIWPR